MTTLPAEVEYGFVVGRFLIAQGDGADVDTLPDAIAAAGSVKLTPVTTTLRTTTNPATILRAPITCTIAPGGDGWMVDGQGRPGVWLALGMYDVTFTFTNASMGGYRISVTAEHTEEAPLDLTLAAPLTPTPATVFVVNEQVYTETIAARDQVVTLLDGLGNPVLTVNGVSADETGDVAIEAGGVSSWAEIEALPDKPDLATKPQVSILAAALKRTTDTRRCGMNVAGAEFSDINVVWAGAQPYQYLASRQHNLIRLPFLWESAQPTLSGPLDPTFEAGLDAEVDAIYAAGMSVILDLHNYAGRDGLVYGETGAFTQADLVDFWTRISTKYKDHPGVIGYGLMNEPGRDPLPTVGGVTGNDRWKAAQQACVTGIRANGDPTCILIGGFTASSIGSWLNATSGQPTPYIVDPADNFRWEAHHYWDSNGGRYLNTYAQELTNTAGWGTGDTVEKQAMFYLNQWIDWLVTNKQRGYLGEFGWPSAENGIHAGDATAWNALAEKYLARLDELPAGLVWWTAWATGPRWSAGYDLQFYNETSGETLGTPLTNAAVLEAHLVAPAPVTEAVMDAAVSAAAATKVDAVATASRVYATTSAGAQTTHPLDAAATASTVALRATGGVLRVGTPVGTSDATPKTYVDTALAAKAPTASPTFTGTVSGVTKAHVGLGSVDNTADTAKPVSTAQQAALDAKAPLASPTFTGTVSGVTKAMVGLGSVDNTADTAKPVSTAQAAADAERWRDRGLFASGTPYAVNDVIRNNNGVYRCMTAHTSGAGGPTVDGDVTYWERVGTVTTTGLTWSASTITSGLMSLDRMPAGAMISTTNAGARPTSRTDLVVVFLTTTDPAAVSLSTDLWFRQAT